jgi:type I restriction enzyme, S subunit
MSRYKAYPEYRDSGVEWLGNIPVGWDCVRLKFASELSGKKVAPSNEAKYVGLENIQSNNGRFVATEDVTPEGISNSFSCGDVLFGKLRPYLAKSWLADFSGICSSELLVLTSKKVNPRFLHYFTLTEEFIDQVDSSTYGSKMPRASWDFIGLLEVPIPCNESKKIAHFLDHETAKIDALIEKQQRLVELLKEKRQAVISHAVTKGLNPNAPMKDSGVEWLGEVPAHWKVASLGYYAQISTGATPDRSNQSYWNGSIPWIKTGEVKYDEIFEAEEYISEEAVAKSSVKLSPPGTVLMAMYGQGVTRGRVAILGVAATYNQACAAINARLEVWNKYLIFFFMAAYHAIRDDGNETSQMNLNADIVGKFKISIPPLNEQHQIVDCITPKIEKFDSMISQSETAISLMQERRTALISAAVTGKIDVRDWQPAVAQEEAGIECGANLS